jgi:hypothetical protein
MSTLKTTIIGTHNRVDEKGKLYTVPFFFSFFATALHGCVLVNFAVFKQVCYVLLVFRLFSPPPPNNTETVRIRISVLFSVPRIHDIHAQTFEILQYGSFLPFFSITSYIAFSAHEKFLRHIFHSDHSKFFFVLYSLYELFLAVALMTYHIAADHFCTGVHYCGGRTWSSMVRWTTVQRVLPLG